VGQVLGLAELLLGSVDLVGAEDAHEESGKWLA
jgi:hypothetical protein